MIKRLMVLLKIPLVAETLLLEMFLSVSVTICEMPCPQNALISFSVTVQTLQKQLRIYLCSGKAEHTQWFMPCNTLHRLMMTSCSWFPIPHQVIKELLSTSGTNRKQWSQPTSLHFSEFPKKPSQVFKKAVQWHLYDLTFKSCLSVLVLFSICYDGFSVHFTFLWCCWWFILICYKLPWWLQPKMNTRN